MTPKDDPTPTDPTDPSSSSSSSDPPTYSAQINLPQASKESSPQEITVDLQSVPVKVTSIKFQGLSRTKNDYLVNATQHIFKAKDFGDLITRLGQAQKTLKSLDVFSEVGTIVDTTKNKFPKEDANVPDAYDITFLLKEHRPLNGGISTMVGANEGIVQIGLKFPNILGRGEKLSLSKVMSSSSERRTEIALTKPFPYSNMHLTTSLYSSKTPNPHSTLNTASSGGIIDWCLKWGDIHTLSLQYDLMWRHLTALNQATSFKIREFLGQSVKSALRLIYTVDKRDQVVFPTQGTFKKVTVEVAGLLGDARFLKVESDWQYNVPLLNNIKNMKRVGGGWVQGVTLQSTFRLGYLQPLSSCPNSYSINDLFFLGGPLNLRGFAMRGVGPRGSTNKNNNNNVGNVVDAMGGKAFWATGLHLFSPLPFVSNKIADNLRLHGFINCGGIGEDFSVSAPLTQSIRGACGLGLAYRFGNLARMELNYCFPFKFSPSDKCVNGVQFGLGVEFL